MSSLETIGVYPSVVTAELLDTEMCLFYPLVLDEYSTSDYIVDIDLKIIGQHAGHKNDFHNFLIDLCRS